MKKILLFTAFLTFIILNVNAQQWAKSLQGKVNPTFFEIQKAFNDYYNANPDEGNNGIEKDGDYEKYKRWEWYWEQRVSQTGEFPPSDIIWKEWEKYNKSHSSNREKNVTNTGDWVFMGPYTTSNLSDYSGLGRVNCIGFNPINPNSFWVGSPAGGLWKTTDAGTTWTTNTDYFPVLGISDIAIDPSDSNNIFIATGDGDGAFTSSGGDTKSIGVLNSIDGGNTWATTGLNWNVTSQKFISRLIINPTNSLNLLAAVSDGIYLTSDGGITWTNQQAGYFKDIQFNPSNQNYVYATTFNPFGGAQIFTSTDGGATWTQVTTLSGISRIKLAVSPAWPDEVDALCANPTPNYGLAGLYYSTDDGATFNEYWQATDCSYNLLNGTIPPTTLTCTGQGFYDLAYAINPSDESQFFLGGVNTWGSIDSGTAWSPINYWVLNNLNGLPCVHGDKHSLVFHPLNNNYIFECNDGGVNYSSDGGTTWTNITNGLQISEIYRICPSATILNDVVCGLQDNGTKELYSGVWHDQLGGDGMECIIDYTNANIEYGARYLGDLYKTTDGWNSTSQITTTIPFLSTEYFNGHTQGAWVTPFVIHPSNPQILYAGYKRLYETTDRGNTWTAISPQLTSDNLRSIAIAPSNPNTIYTSSLDTLYITYDGGNTWTYNPLGISNANITYLIVHPTNPQTVWMTLSGYVAGQKVFKSIDGGITWTNISGSLPNLPVNCIVYQTGNNDGLYIGTDVGVYYTDNSMGDWIQYNTGLPNVVVNDLKISYNNNKLWAGTFGRGLWNSDLYSTTVGISSLNNKSNINLFPNPNNGNFTLSYHLSIPNAEFQIHDVTGRIVYDYNIIGISGTQNIDVSSLSQGVYFYTIKSGDNIETHKLVITK